MGLPAGLEALAAPAAPAGLGQPCCLAEQPLCPLPWPSRTQTAPTKQVGAVSLLPRWSPLSRLAAGALQPLLQHALCCGGRPARPCSSLPCPACPGERKLQALRQSLSVQVSGRGLCGADLLMHKECQHTALRLKCCPPGPLTPACKQTDQTYSLFAHRSGTSWSLSRPRQSGSRRTTRRPHGAHG